MLARPPTTLLALAPALALALSACSDGGDGDTAPEAATFFTAERLEAATRALTDLGPRPSGSPAERQARDLVVDRLTALGLTPRTHAFVWEPWLRGQATITAGGQSWPAQALSPSPSVTGLEAPLLAEGDDQLAGAIGLYRSADGSRAGQFSDAVFAGVAGMIRVTDDRGHDGQPLVEVGHTLTGSQLPAVAVDRATGDALATHLGGPITLDIAADTLPGHESHNVLARLPGDDDAHPVYVTAHYDSWDGSESAIDNALGVAVLVELAAWAAAADRRERSIVFLATAGEEQGLTGAFRYTQDEGDAARAAAFVLNLDIPWAHEGTYYVSSTDPEITALGLESAASEGLDAADGGLPSPASDHLPFEILGVASAWHTRWPDRHYHTTEDTVEHLDFAEVAAAARVNRDALSHVAGVR